MNDKFKQTKGKVEEKTCRSKDKAGSTMPSDFDAFAEFGASSVNIDVVVTRDDGTVVQVPISVIQPFGTVEDCHHRPINDLKFWYKCLLRGSYSYGKNADYECLADYQPSTLMCSSDETAVI